jgi:hypothetical protein
MAASTKLLSNRQPPLESLIFVRVREAIVGRAPRRNRRDDPNFRRMTEKTDVAQRPAGVDVKLPLRIAALDASMGGFR